MQMPGLTDEEAKAFLEGTWVAKLATHNEDGAVRMTPLTYAVEDGTILFYTWEQSKATANLRRDQRASVLIDDPNPPYQGIHYVGRAEAHPVDRSADKLADAFGRYSGSREEAIGFYDFIDTIGPHVLITFRPEQTLSWDLAKVGG